MKGKPWLNIVGLVVAWGLIFLVFSLLVPKSFPTFNNLSLLSKQGAVTAVAALGMTYVIVAGGIDLSVGSVAAFSCVVSAWLVLNKVDPLLSIFGGMAAGALCGLLNGVLITGLKVVPFIVTLGTYLVVRGLAKGLANEQTVNPPDTWVGNLLASPKGSMSWIVLPVGVWITLGLALVMAATMRYTRFGRHVVAIGSNEQAARLCGVPVQRIKLLVFMLNGFFAGLTGVLVFSRLTVGDPTAAQGLELDAIAAVVIGGASLNGGQGSIAGTLLGALIMTTIRSGGAQYGLSNWVQEVVTGTIIVLAVALDRLRMRGETS